MGVTMIDPSLSRHCRDTPYWLSKRTSTGYGRFLARVWHLMRCTSANMRLVARLGCFSPDCT